MTIVAVGAVKKQLVNQVNPLLFFLLVLLLLLQNKRMLTSLCSKVTVYGFGVEGLAKFSRGIGIGVNETAKDEKHAELNYHYFHGLGARKEGNDVHCFDNEERTFEALSQPPASLWEFCKYKDDGGDRNWNCGCQHANIEKCRLDKLEGEYAGLEDSTDCTPGEDCPEDEAKRN